MLLSRIWALCLCAAAAEAFRDTSPFFAFSTSRLLKVEAFEGQHVSPLRSSQVSNLIHKTMQSCPSDAYILVSLPDVSAKDFSGRNAAPHLRKRMQTGNGDTQSSVTITDVGGQLDVLDIQSYLEMHCNAASISFDASRGYMSLNNSYPQLIKIDFPSLPTSSGDRAAKLAEHDSFLNIVINYLETHSYTVFFTTTPLSAAQQDLDTQQHPANGWNYDAEESFPFAMHTDLKRDLYAHLRASNDSTGQGGPPLFEKYNFLSPGIFMGVFVILILLSILYVGISAIAGLEVSYGAFTKEMGATAQTSKQQ